jgi:hypothetical protein
MLTETLQSVEPLISAISMTMLHYVHEMNAYRAGLVCLSVRPYDSTQEPLDRSR